MTFHIGILGGGNISQTHARAASEIADAKIVAFCGQSAEKVRGLAATFGGRAYQDLRAFMNHKPMEVVLIGSPSGLHAEQGIQAAQHGLHILVEKPLAITTEEADVLIAECEGAGVKLGVFFQDRVAPDLIRLKEFLDAGKLGKPFLASARVKWCRTPEYYANSRWRGTWALDGGGALMNQGIHTVDSLLWLMGDVRAVWARAISARHNIEVEDTLVAALQFASGALGTLEVTTSVYPGYPRRLEVSGSEGTIIIQGSRVISADLHTSAAEFLVQPPSARDERAISPLISDTHGHRQLIEDLLQAIVTQRRPLCDGREARRSVDLVRAIYDSTPTQRLTDTSSASGP